MEYYLFEEERTSAETRREKIRVKQARCRARRQAGGECTGRTIYLPKEEPTPTAAELAALIARRHGNPPEEGPGPLSAAPPADWPAAAIADCTAAAEMAHRRFEDAARSKLMVPPGPGNGWTTYKVADDTEWDFWRFLLKAACGYRLDQSGYLSAEYKADCRLAAENQRRLHPPKRG